MYDAYFFSHAEILYNLTDNGQVGYQSQNHLSIHCQKYRNDNQKSNCLEKQITMAKVRSKREIYSQQRYEKEKRSVHYALGHSEITASQERYHAIRKRSAARSL